MIPPTAVLFGLLVASPTLWGALMNNTVAVDVAFRRITIILVVATLGWIAVQRLVNPFVVAANRSAVEGREARESHDSAASRRSTDG